MSLKLANLERIYVGKTKDVYAYDEKSIVLHSKDSVTGWKVQNPDGTVTVVEDPGANEVIGEVAGIGLKNIISSVHYFNMFEAAGLSTAFLDADLTEKNILLKKAEKVGHGLECIVRFKAMGSILRTYPDYVKEGQELTDFFEVTTKHDAAGDPRISKEFLTNPDFGPAMTSNQYDDTKALCLKAAGIIKDDLAKHDLDLIDIKFEIGMVDDQIILIDEISAGIMRVFKNGKQFSEEELADFFVSQSA
ncbi:phosphoribosylaminoimidazole-succinocarboxamide synthase [Paenibacillus sp. 1_12]|uniref:phosphoribosylaminoimidazolesuccinocarboxamide synthase n=1 Tax=Paenibacillus sp. 1_12 TaxID=1566278 RepID=UPI0008E3DD33|nr:phosphoribosylaminoimidazolesuccinocarboxamide synthase [Paenibacillus sp. 1_12]SFM40378.1 phosphoribosylaminoimidazole-succinocarboxamide synthase [Paenibacillus sp. 1_12]